MASDTEGLHIACSTSLDPRLHGRTSMSHTLHNACRALQQQCGDVTMLGPVSARREQIVGKGVDIACQALLHKRFMYFHSAWVARRFGAAGARQLAQANRRFDILFAGGSVDVAYLPTNIPLVLMLDATFAGLREYYPAYSNLTHASRRELDDIERTAIRRASLLLYSSAWAARSAIDEYGANPDKVHVIPFGADLDSPPAATIVASRRRGDHCQLLFLGADWERKGGAIALATLIELEKMGIATELIVCGCVPPPGVAHPHMRVIPYLDKRDKRQREELDALFLTSDFLLLPTRGDCTPVVLCEAAAFGLPAIATDTGGVAEYVRDGETGFTLPLAAGGDAYARVIAEAYGDEQRSLQLSRASRAHFDDRLNWDAWAHVATPLIRALVNRGDIGSGVAALHEQGRTRRA